MASWETRICSEEESLHENGFLTAATTATVRLLREDKCQAGPKGSSRSSLTSFDILASSNTHKC